MYWTGVVGVLSAEHTVDLFENKIKKVRRKIPTKTTAEILEQNRAVFAETSPQGVYCTHSEHTCTVLEPFFFLISVKKVALTGLQSQGTSFTSSEGNKQSTSTARRTAGIAALVSCGTEEVKQ